MRKFSILQYFSILFAFFYIDIYNESKGIGNFFLPSKKL